MERRQLFDRIKQMIADDPENTVSKIAGKLERNRSGVYAMLRRYRQEHGIDLAQFSRNAENIRLHRIKERVRKPVRILTPDGEPLDFSSLTEACGTLEEIYGIPFPKSSVSVSITQNRPFGGFLFHYPDRLL